MSSAAAISANFYQKRSTDELIRARDLVSNILDDRARQASLFEVPRPSTIVDAPAVSQNCDIAPVSCVPAVLSPSSLNTYNACSAKWFYRKVLQLPETRGAALGLGTAVHEAILLGNFKEKIHTGEDLPVVQVKQLFRDAMFRELDSIVLAPGESAGDLMETGEAAVEVFMMNAAPAIQPSYVERPVSGAIGGVPVRGFIDLMDSDGAIIDIKTAGKKPSGFPVDHRVQVTSYTMLASDASGKARLDTLTKTKTVALHSQTIDIGAADRKHAEKLYSITMDQMNSGLVKPSRGSFTCSRKYCSFWERCEDEFGGKVGE